MNKPGVNRSLFKRIGKLAVWPVCMVCVLSSFLAKEKGGETGHPPGLGGTTDDHALRPAGYDGYGAEASGALFPYKAAGLTERQAAAHLLDRFTFGATPGQVGEVVKEGLEKWFYQQLRADNPDDSLHQLLSGYDALSLSNEEIIKTFLKGGQVLRMAVRDGLIDKDSVDKGDKKQYRAQLEDYMRQKGIKPEKELFRQFVNQKILRAAYTQNQLQEVLTDFWFNHFNVSITKNDCSQFIPAYERDVIRPNALGRFEGLLLATAKSPAMLFYLDNFSSTGRNTNFAGKPFGNGGKQGQGLNENYAREVMELHTLGVDGGYSQTDVTQVARVLTGWTVYPMGEYGNGARKLVETMGEDRLKLGGFVHEGDFLFAPNRHDNGEKTIMGKTFSAGGGYEEGVDLLKMLAHHPSTAKFIARKIAVRFVGDDPPQSLVDKMAKTFMDKDGDIRQVLLTIVGSREFWSREALREKIKSPFELAISSVRGLGASITMPYPLYTWITKMGQKIYYYQAPTGFPDKGQYWINTGSLLSRMNFGLALASGRIPGIAFSLAALNNHHEPESTGAALVTYCRLLMPERDLTATIRRLTPLLNDPALEKKVGDASGKSGASGTGQDGLATQNIGADQNMEATKGMDASRNAGAALGMDGMQNRQTAQNRQRQDPQTRRSLQRNGPDQGPGSELGDGTMMEYEKEPLVQPATAVSNSPLLSQVVGIIIGSPEFQRR